MFFLVNSRLSKTNLKCNLEKKIIFIFNLYQFNEILGTQIISALTLTYVKGKIKWQNTFSYIGMYTVYVYMQNKSYNIGYANCAASRIYNNVLIKTKWKNCL